MPLSADLPSAPGPEGPTEAPEQMQPAPPGAQRGRRLAAAVAFAESPPLAANTATVQWPARTDSFVHVAELASNSAYSSACLCLELQTVLTVQNLAASDHAKMNPWQQTRKGARDLLLCCRLKLHPKSDTKTANREPQALARFVM